jgi:hypothetical protein
MNTASIGKAQAGAQPQAADPAPFIQSTEWDHLHTLLQQVEQAIGKLPAPCVTAEHYPISLAHALPIKRVVEVQRWWQEFTRFWAARDPEIQRHRREVQDFIRENRSHVAAE